MDRTQALVRRFAGRKIRQHFREIMLTELNPARRAGGDQRQDAAAANAVDQLRSLLHDRQIRRRIGIKDLIKAQHTHRCHHLACHIGTDRIAEFLAERRAPQPVLSAR